MTITEALEAYEKCECIAHKELLGGTIQKVNSLFCVDENGVFVDAKKTIEHLKSLDCFTRGWYVVRINEVSYV